jgi:hypothetical protein
MNRSFSMTDEPLDIDEPLDVSTVPSNPWFESIGQVEFVKFQSELETLGRYRAFLETSLRDFIIHERAAFEQKEYLQGVPTSYSGEAEMFAEDELAGVENVMPLFVYGSLLALCFTLLEQLMDDLVHATKDVVGQSLKDFPRKRREPTIEWKRRFLASTTNTLLEIDVEVDRELTRLRGLRNGFVHAASEEKVPGTVKVSTVRIDGEDIESAFATIGAYAYSLELEIADFFD